MPVTAISPVEPATLSPSDTERSDAGIADHVVPPTSSNTQCLAVSTIAGATSVPVQSWREPSGRVWITASTDASSEAVPFTSGLSLDAAPAAHATHTDA